MATRKRKLIFDDENDDDDDDDDGTHGNSQRRKRTCLRPVPQEVGQYLQDILQKLNELDQRLRAVEELASYVQQKRAEDAARLCAYQFYTS